MGNIHANAGHLWKVLAEAALPAPQISAIQRLHYQGSSNSSNYLSLYLFAIHGASSLLTMGLLREDISTRTSTEGMIHDSEHLVIVPILIIFVPCYALLNKIL